jgi:quercetin dioxygenase-like cupin family protein
MMMLTRRGFAVCALCAFSGFAATGAEAQSSPIKRTILQRTDGPTPGYETVIALIEIEAGADVARHTHPGMESTFALEGETTLMVDGQSPRKLGPGDAFQIPAGVPHSAKNGDKPARLVGNYIVEKGKPLASPA